MTLASPEEKDFEPKESRLTEAVASYLDVLAARAPGTLTFRTGAGRILRDLLLRWPTLDGVEVEAQALCNRISDAVYPLASALYAQAVELTITISAKPMPAPTHVEGFSSYVLFDADAGIERRFFLSPDHKLPDADLMRAPRGVEVLSRPLNYRYQTLRDDRPVLSHVREGMFGQPRRALEALTEEPEYASYSDDQKDIVEDMIEDLDHLADVLVQYYELQRRAGRRPYAATGTALAALPAAVRALVRRMLAYATNENLPPSMRLAMRRAAQTLRALYPEATLEEAALTETASPFAGGLGSPPAPRYTYDDLHKRGISDVQSRRRPDPALYNAAHAAYRDAYDSAIIANEAWAASLVPGTYLAQNIAGDLAERGASDAQYGSGPDARYYSNPIYARAYETERALERRAHQAAPPPSPPAPEVTPPPAAPPPEAHVPPPPAVPAPPPAVAPPVVHELSHVELALQAKRDAQFGQQPDPSLYASEASYRHAYDDAKEHAPHAAPAPAAGPREEAPHEERAPSIAGAALAAAALTPTPIAAPYGVSGIGALPRAAGPPVGVPPPAAGTRVPPPRFEAGVPRPAAEIRVPPARAFVPGGPPAAAPPRAGASPTPAATPSGPVSAPSAGGPPAGVQGPGAQAQPTVGPRATAAAQPPAPQATPAGGVPQMGGGGAPGPTPVQPFVPSGLPSSAERFERPIVQPMGPAVPPLVQPPVEAFHPTVSEGPLVVPFPPPIPAAIPMPETLIRNPADFPAPSRPMTTHYGAMGILPAAAAFRRETPRGIGIDDESRYTPARPFARQTSETLPVPLPPRTTMNPEFGHRAYSKLKVPVADNFPQTVCVGCSGKLQKHSRAPVATPKAKPKFSKPKTWAFPTPGISPFPHGPFGGRDDKMV